MNIRKLTTYALIASMAVSFLTGCKRDAEVTETSDMAPAPVVTTTAETTPETTEFKLYSADEYRNAGVNELNSVPILMYHRVYNMKNSETKYTGGNGCVNQRERSRYRQRRLLHRRAVSRSPHDP